MRIVARDPNAVVVLFKFLFMAEVTYGFSCTLVKLSLLASSTCRCECFLDYCRAGSSCDTMSAFQSVLVPRTTITPRNKMHEYNTLLDGQLDSELRH
ncbi:hypothetical protein F4815DRAFT_470480 [Daldinia loculata]|nr:hypothetical protein F4815DRAFT_470480 [Daldinia loculata]